MFVENLVTCKGQALGLAEYVSKDLGDITEYLLGVLGGTEEFILGILKKLSVVVDRSILGGHK